MDEKEDISAKYAGGTTIACCGVIGPISGKVHFHFQPHSCNAQTMKSVLQEVRKKLGRERKLAMFLDNASMHANPDVIKFARTVVLIPLIFNMPYRPDAMGIERFWGFAK